MRVFIVATCVGTAVVLAAPPAHGISVSAKAKAKKILSFLVPAYSPVYSGDPTKDSGAGDDEGDTAPDGIGSPAILATPFLRSSRCTFEFGKVIFVVGKDAKVLLKKVVCDGQPYNGSLCAHTKTLSTIMDEDVDKKGNVTAQECLAPNGSHTENTIQFVTGNVGLISCSNGTCKGTIPPVTDDPCPAVDKVTEVRRFEVFDGPELGSTVISGATLASCCGPNQVVAGPIPVSPFCDPNSTQDVMAEMGYINQGQ